MERTDTSCGIHKLVADVAVFIDGKVLMVKYKDTSKYDGQRGWFLPDDYLNYLEHPDEAATRILRQQVEVKADEVRLAFIESFGNGWWHLIFHYRADLKESPTLRLGENIATLDWFPLDRLPAAEEMAHHGWACDVLAAMGILS